MEASVLPGFGTCVKAIVNGTEYAVGDVLFYRDVSGGPVLLATVISILSSGKELRFSCKCLITRRFCKHVMAFEVTEGSSTMVICASDLADFQPASVYMGKYVAPNRRICF